MVDDKIPEDKEVWQLLMVLKDIVELVVSPVFTDERIEMSVFWSPKFQRVGILKFSRGEALFSTH